MEPLSSSLSTTLAEFDGEATLYCTGISDNVAQNYALNYARMLADRLRGLEAALPRIPHGLFEPNRKLIQATLDGMLKKYFPGTRKAAR
jgi:hypothetical protein